MRKSILYIIASLFFLFSFTLVHAQDLHNGHENHSEMNHKPASVVNEIWTCSMHPNIKMKEPGKCPICGMELIPVEQDESSSSGEQVTLRLSEAAQKLADIQTASVKRQSIDKEIRLVGTIDYDETRLTHITAWVPGRIERMFVDFKGIKVNKGDHMFELYSPALLSAQEELIQANKSLKKLQNSSSALVRKSTERAAKSAEDKLLLLGLTKGQVKEIILSGKAKDNVTIYAPVGGVVVERSATEGMYVKEGSRVYSIADLNSLWVYLDAYESDLPWIRYGQKVKFSTQALPGVTFEGVVSFISPIVNSETRTTRIRVNVNNDKGILKPGLFVKGIIHAEVYGESKVLNTALKGKYIGPMHPEVIQDEPGQCPVCEMDLVPAEDLGYVTEEIDSELPLVIPVSAPLITGKRAVVYVKNPNEPIFEARNVILGPEAGDYYVVAQGLKENELVVSNGAFKIDADLQIKGKRSMMNPKGIEQSIGHQHGNMKQEKANSNHKNHINEKTKAKEAKASKDELVSILNAYLKLSDTLASDNLEESKVELLKIQSLVFKFTNHNLKEIFEGQSIQHVDLESARVLFGKLSDVLIPLVENSDLSKSVTAFKAHCPMALKGKGAYWMQKDKQVKNPYYGASMLACGLIEGEI